MRGSPSVPVIFPKLGFVRPVTGLDRCVAFARLKASKRYSILPPRIFPFSFLRQSSTAGDAVILRLLPRHSGHGKKVRVSGSKIEAFLLRIRDVGRRRYLGS